MLTVLWLLDLRLAHQSCQIHQPWGAVPEQRDQARACNQWLSKKQRWKENSEQFMVYSSWRRHPRLNLALLKLKSKGWVLWTLREKTSNWTRSKTFPKENTRNIITAENRNIWLLLQPFPNGTLFAWQVSSESCCARLFDPKNLTDGDNEHFKINDLHN